MKKRVLVIVAILIFVLSLTACNNDFGKGQSKNTVYTIPDNGIVKAKTFSDLKGQDTIGIFENKDKVYQWSFFGKYITDPKDTDLSLKISNDLGDNYEHLFEQYQAFNIADINAYPGVPSLRIKLIGDWKDEKGEAYPTAFIYHFDGQKATYIKYTVIGDGYTNFSFEKIISGTIVISCVKPEGLDDPVHENYRKPDAEPEDDSLNPVVTIKIACDTAVANWDNLVPEVKFEQIVPKSGVILASTEYFINKGDDVFDVLYAVTRARKIQMESRDTPFLNSRYIVSINNLREFDGGNLSGWMFCVNGWYPNYGVSRYKLKNGDKIEFNYTCDLGRDLDQFWL